MDNIGQRFKHVRHELGDGLLSYHLQVKVKLQLTVAHLILSIMTPGLDIESRTSLLK